MRNRTSIREPLRPKDTYPIEIPCNCHEVGATSLREHVLSTFPEVGYKQRTQDIRKKLPLETRVNHAKSIAWALRYMVQWGWLKLYRRQYIRLK